MHRSRAILYLVMAAVFPIAATPTLAQNHEDSAFVVATALAHATAIVPVPEGPIAIDSMTFPGDKELAGVVAGRMGLSLTTFSAAAACPAREERTRRGHPRCTFVTSGLSALLSVRNVSISNGNAEITTDVLWHYVDPDSHQARITGRQIVVGLSREGEAWKIVESRVLFQINIP